MRYKPGMSQIIQGEDVGAGREFMRANVDLNGPIEFDVLKDQIEKNGPLIFSNQAKGVKFHVNITTCRAENCACNNDIITLTQISGVSTLQTSIDKEKLLQCQSLLTFFDDFYHNPFAYYSSSGERQFIEAQIREHLGFSPLDIYFGKMSTDDIPKVRSDHVLDDWRVHNLQSDFRCLLLHRLELEHFRDDDFQEELQRRFLEPDEFVNFLQYIYDLGFLTSRLTAEYFIREDIEPLAELGEKAQEDLARRTEASGKRSAQTRRDRIDTLLTELEMLIEKNPDIGLVGIESLSRIAAQKAKLVYPKLWSQGLGQVSQYLLDAKFSQEFSDRYTAILGRTA